MSLSFFRNVCCVTCALVSLALAPCAHASNDAVQVRQDAPAATTKDVSWALRLPEETKVVYKGVVSFDEAGTGHGSMMYPAANAGGFVAALITHAIIIGSVRSSQKTKLEEAADQVLLPYQAALENFTYRDLMQEGLNKTSAKGSKKLIAFSDKPDTDKLIESAPVFSLTQDQSAIILDNVISIYASDAPTVAIYQNTVRVVSQAREETDIASFWNANQGALLKNESASLFAHSLDIALSEAANSLGAGNHPQKTFRYFEGKLSKMERGQLIQERCGRTVMKTLRGWMMSFPVRSDATTSSVNNACSNTFSQLN